MSTDAISTLEAQRRAIKAAKRIKEALGDLIDSNAFGLMEGSLQRAESLVNDVVRAWEHEIKP